MQIYTITHEPPHSLYRTTHIHHRTSPFPPQNRSIYLRNRPRPPLLLPHPCKEATPHLPTLANTSYEPPHISPPLPDSSSTNDPTSTHLYLTPHTRTTPHLRTHEAHHICASSPSNSLTKRPKSAHPCPTTYARTAARLPTHAH